MTITDGEWDPDSRTLLARLSGNVDAEDVARWKRAVGEALARVEDGSRFKLLVDYRGYEPASLDAHKAMRDFIPLLLADHGHRTALADLFDEPPEFPVRTLRGVACAAVAFVHHDGGKMDEYERSVGRENERFFVDRERADAWLRSRP